MGDWGWFHGWRIVFLSSSLVALAVSILTFQVAEDPRKEFKNRIIGLQDRKGVGLKTTLKEAASILKTELIALLQLPTFVIIVIQGKGQTLNYFTLYFNYVLTWLVFFI